MVIFQNETLNLQGIYTLSKILIYSTMINKNIVMYWGNYKHKKKQVAKYFIEKFILMKRVILGKNDI
jgi:hypothetical protein